MPRHPCISLRSSESPSPQREALSREIESDLTARKPRGEKAKKSRHGEPVGVSIEDQIASLIRKFPQLKPVFHCYRKHREKRVRELQLRSPEKERLLYQILAAKKTGKRKSSMRSYERIRQGGQGKWST